MRRASAPIILLVALGIVAGTLYLAVRQTWQLIQPSASDDCTAHVAGRTVELTRSQAENAALIAAVAERRGLPARAVSIAITTAYQESGLENLPYGDRDSLGMFQQRPSMGWGTPSQLLNRSYATNAFYNALVKVPEYESMDITEAAQTVQRSGFPSAYRDHEADGRALASALTGNSEAALSCDVPAEDLARQPMGADGLTARAEAVRRNILRTFGDLPLGGFAPGGVNSGHMSGSLHYQGRAIDVSFPATADDSLIRGWALAQYLVANSARLHVEHVIYDGRVWTAGSGRGWHHYTPPDLTGDESAATLAVLEHRDHVHVDVF